MTYAVNQEYEAGGIRVHPINAVPKHTSRSDAKKGVCTSTFRARITRIDLPFTLRDGAKVDRAIHTQVLIRSTQVALNRPKLVPWLQTTANQGLRNDAFAEAVVCDTGPMA